MNILITGSAGFIGFHLSLNLLNDGHSIIGIDNLNDYYDRQLKLDRLHILNKNKNFIFHEFSIEDNRSLENLFKKSEIEYVINLAAYAGVRHSLIKPQDYINANLIGFANLIELSKEYEIKHFLYASSSSVYGVNSNLPFLEEDNTDHPVSLYGATKKANETLAHSYSHIFNLPTTGLRFFTVYGPWGRPDMALFKFTDAIVKGSPIKIYNHGKHRRDFTYVDDIVTSINKLLFIHASSDEKFDTNDPNPSSSSAPWKIYNIGNSECIELDEFITIIEDTLNTKAKKTFLDFQLGDVEASFASTEKLSQITNFKPYTPLNTGIKKFIEWYLDYYKIKEIKIT